MPYEPIYRDYELTRMSKDACTKFLHALAASGGSITSSYSLSNGFNNLTYSSMFFRLHFGSQLALDKFHDMGHTTTTPAKITLNSNHE